MNTDTLLALLTLLLSAMTAIGVAVGKQISAIRKLLDRMADSVRELHGRIDRLKDHQHAESIKVADRIARIETLVERYNGRRE